MLDYTSQRNDRYYNPSLLQRQRREEPALTPFDHPYHNPSRSAYNQQRCVNPINLTTMPSPSAHDSYAMERNFSGVSWTSDASSNSAYSAASPTSTTSTSRDGDSHPWTCHYCPHASTRKADLERHLYAKHLPADLRPRFDCPIPGCARVGANGLPRADKLQEHLRDRHHVDAGRKGPGKGKERLRRD